MKTLIVSWMLALTVFVVLWKTPQPVLAQSGSNGVMILNPVGAPSACSWPSGITVTNGMALCPTTSGLYYALNGSTTFNPVAAPPPPAGVTSFATRTGAVVPVEADYAGLLKFSDLASPPTTATCSSGTAQETINATGTSGGTSFTSFSLSGCTFK